MKPVKSFLNEFGEKYQLTHVYNHRDDSCTLSPVESPTHNKRYFRNLLALIYNQFNRLENPVVPIIFFEEPLSLCFGDSEFDIINEELPDDFINELTEAVDQYVATPRDVTPTPSPKKTKSQYRSAAGHGEDDYEEVDLGNSPTFGSSTMFPLNNSYLIPIRRVEFDEEHHKSVLIPGTDKTSTLRIIFQDAAQAQQCHEVIGDNNAAFKTQGKTSTIYVFKGHEDTTKQTLLGVIMPPTKRQLAANLHSYIEARWNEPEYITLGSSLFGEKHSKSVKLAAALALYGTLTKDAYIRDARDISSDPIIQQALNQGRLGRIFKDILKQQPKERELHQPGINGGL